MNPLLKRHKLAVNPVSPITLRIYYRANGTLLRRVHGMCVCAQALS